MVQVLGRLVYDVKVSTVEIDKEKVKVLNNRIAIKGSNKATFIDIVAWKGTAELIEKYYKKGFEILLNGKLINVSKKKSNVEYEDVAIQIKEVIFTYGNKEIVNDFL